jgi:FtsH-binding integral membrane protein
MSQTPAPDALTVHDLQAMAAEAASAAAPAQKARSRAANLHLIDLLSRWGGSGLAALAAAAIFIAASIARGQPLRAGVWAAMVFAALYLCRRYRKEFRRGDKIAARPFRWRAYYTSSLAVVSAAFGAGAFLLAVPATGAARIEIFAVLIAGTLAAAALHAAHRMAGLAAMAPAAAFIAAAAIRTGGVSAPSLGVIALLAAGAAGVVIASGRIGDAADRRFPRTGLVRREIERGDAPQSAVAVPLATAAAKA